MANIAFLLDTDFEQVEYTKTKQLLEEKGHKTTLITTQPKNKCKGSIIPIKVIRLPLTY